MDSLMGIRIGTCARYERENEYERIKDILQYGFESISIQFGPAVEAFDLTELAIRTKEIVGEYGARISTVSCYGNTLAEGEAGEQSRRIWQVLIDNAHHFGTDLVTGFTGRIKDRSISDCIPQFKEVFEPLVRKARDQGVRMAFENWEGHGDWYTGDYNIAHSPQAWELMFEALPYENLGLEWEPCHQMKQLIEPLPQLKRWLKRIFHVHGKDANVHWDVIRESGLGGPRAFACDRFPGFGDCNWAHIISELIRGGYTGSIDIEGWHDPIYTEDLEMTGQVRALKYLTSSRGMFVPNPDWR